EAVEFDPVAGEAVVEAEANFVLARLAGKDGQIIDEFIRAAGLGIAVGHGWADSHGVFPLPVLEAADGELVSAVEGADVLARSAALDVLFLGPCLWVGSSLEVRRNR